MAIRRRALERVGGFDEAMRGRGDEEEWERRYKEAGGRIRYVAAAGLDHRRSAADSTLRRLSRAAYGHGRAGRRYDVRKGEAPSLAAEARTLLGCVWHIFRRRCANGIVLTAQAAGRLRESVAGSR
jgi:GT2 family glycosyltransferase